MDVNSMKTEDALFEKFELPQRGFQAKRKMAMDKLQDGKCKYCVDGCIACDAMAQPAQEQWNAALDEATSRIGEIKSFGQTTQDSFAVFIQGLKK